MFSNAKTRRIVSIILLLFFSIAIFSVTRSILWPRRIKVVGDNAIVRVPGEYVGKAYITYNSEYVTQERTGAEITLQFKKNGYYEVTIDGKCYVFEVKDMPDNNYTLDLIQREIIYIQGRAGAGILLITIFADGMIWLAFYVTSLRKNRERNKKKREASRNRGTSVTDNSL